ncbi:MAG TPA: HD domain-containing phosphohydrolase [Fibrobacteria bacterium]|nr:HD domain-containing phosphohydrolase [Fibrobacteria bacterium]
MDQISEEDKELNSLLELNLDELETLGTEDASFRDNSPPAAMTLEKRMAASPRLGRLQAQWDRGEPGDNPSGLPMNRGMDQMSVIERTLTYKATVVKTWDSSVAQARETYDLICLGEVTSMGSVRTLVGSFLDVMEKDRNILLALCLYQSPNLADYLYRHAVNMCLVSLAAATASGFSKGQVLEIGQAALLADVGMMMVPEAILLKAGKLTEPELSEIHRHPSTSFALLEKIQGASDYVLSAAYQHHERMTGAGYPKRRSNAQISQVARIVAIADTLCAMVHKRSHRDALTPQMAMDKVIKMGQMNFLDPALVKNLLRYLSIYPIGTFVELASGRMGRVVSAHPDDHTRPVISVLRSEKGQPPPMKQVLLVDLMKDKNDKIVKVVDSEAAKFKPLDGF